MSNNVGGRPSKYTEEIGAYICSEMSKGRSLNKISKDEDMPALSTIFLWLTKHKVFSDNYTKAIDARAECMFEEMLEIADDGTNDYMLTKDGDKKLDSEHVNRSRLRVDTRKWMLSKMRPIKYGDKQQLEHSGSLNVTSLSDEELDAKIMAMQNEQS